MNPIKREDELEQAVESLADGWRDWVFDQLDGTSFIKDELDKVDEAKKDVLKLVTNLKRQHERELVEAAVMGARFGNAAFRQQSIAAPDKRINLDLVLESGIKQAKDWVSRQV